MLFISICIKDMIGSRRPAFNPQYRQHFSVGIFQDLSTLKGFNWTVSMVKSDLMDTFTITDSSCGSKSKWALVHLCTSKAAANRSNVYVSGKNNKILPIPETMQPAQSQKRKKCAKKKKKKMVCDFKWSTIVNNTIWIVVQDMMKGLNKKNILFFAELYSFLFLMYLNDMPAMFSP